MKIAVYTIAKNEAKHVERWYNSVKNADYLLICDTGSTDNTVEIAESLGINVIYYSSDKFEFHTAKNYTIDHLPEDIDYCIQLDVDEYLAFNWREILESHDLSNSPALMGRMIEVERQIDYPLMRGHGRHNTEWVYPIGEILSPKDTKDLKNYIYDMNFVMYHEPDLSKNRDFYVDLLQDLAEKDERPIVLLNNGLTLYRMDRFEESAPWLVEYLKQDLSNEDPFAISNALRCLAKCQPENAFYYYQKACEVAPHMRESWFDLADFYFANQLWLPCLDACEKAMQITKRPMNFFSEIIAWDHGPYDCAAIAAYQLGNYEKACKYGKIALSISPDETYLIESLEEYKKALIR